MEDSTKTIKYLQQCGLLPNEITKDCMFCGMEKCVALHRRSKWNIQYVLKCSKCRKGESAATNTWFEKGRITKQSEMEVNKKNSDYYGFCRDVCYVIVTNSENVIGGEGKIVQIDESHIYTTEDIS